MSSAQAHVLDTPELLEAILGHLPPRDLLLAQRVSRNFQALIVSSPKLQHSMFLRPAPPNASGDWVINPLLKDAFIPWLVIAEHSFFLATYEELELLDWAQDEKQKQTFLHPDASWRKMFLIQPPPKTMNIVQWSHAMGGDTLSDGKLPLPDGETDGVTMGAIYDIAQSFLLIHEGRFCLYLKDKEDSAPDMTMYLCYTLSCVLDWPRTSRLDLRSNAQKTWAYLDIKFKARPTRGFLDINLLSDLTAERGGVPDYEFEKWKRERAPVSSLLSDVR